MWIPIWTTHPFKAAQLLIGIKLVVIFILFLLSVFLVLLNASTCFSLLAARSNLFAGDSTATISATLR